MRMHYHKLTSQLADCEVSGQRNFSAGYYAPPTYPYYDYSAVRD